LFSGTQDLDPLINLISEWVNALDLYVAPLSRVALAAQSGDFESHRVPIVWLVPVRIVLVDESGVWFGCLPRVGCERHLDRGQLVLELCDASTHPCQRGHRARTKRRGTRAESKADRTRTLATVCSSSFFRPRASAASASAEIATRICSSFRSLFHTPTRNKKDKGQRRKPTRAQCSASGVGSSFILSSPVTRELSLVVSSTALDELSFLLEGRGHREDFHGLALLHQWPIWVSKLLSYCTHQF
jgi:hypothetical protein